jgi:uncharacterized protein
LGKVHVPEKKTYTNIFFVTDVHGSEKCFRKFLNSGRVYDANKLILGGDITGKAIVPIRKIDDKTYMLTYPDGDAKTKAKELEEKIKEIRDSGFYPYVCSNEEFEELKTDDKKLKELFQKLMIENVDSWVKLANERLAGKGTTCYISPGNDDIFAIDEHLVDNGLVVNPENRVVRIDDIHEMITLGFANRTPWHSPREVDEPELEEMIEKLCSQVEEMKNCIFNIHVPPINSLLDQAPKITADFKPVVIGGHIQTMSAGSVATRKMIEKYQPLVGVHGHIHESKASETIGRTVCFNPGSEYGDGTLKGLFLSLEKDKIRSHMFVSG